MRVNLQKTLLSLQSSHNTRQETRLFKAFNQLLQQRWKHYTLVTPAGQKGVTATTTRARKHQKTVWKQLIHKSLELHLKLIGCNVSSADRKKCFILVPKTCRVSKIAFHRTNYCLSIIQSSFIYIFFLSLLQQHFYCFFCLSHSNKL